MHALPITTRAALRPAEDRAGVWSRWPAVGGLRPDVSVQNLYTVHIRLGRAVDDLDEVTAAVSRKLSLFHLMVQHDRSGRTDLVLTLATGDVWQAILLTMNAITSSGYVPEALTVEPAAEFEIHDSRNPGDVPSSPSRT